MAAYQEQTEWKNLLSWLETKGIIRNAIPVQSRVREGAGRGLYTKQSLAPSTPFLRIPSSALLNSRSLKLIYPYVNLEGFEQKRKDKIVLNGTQLLSIHLCVNRPDGSVQDTHFGPYILTLPKQFDSHPLTWLMKKKQNLATACEISLLESCPPGVLSELENVATRLQRDWKIALRCKKDYPQIFHDRGRNESFTMMNFVWAWLNVNTRCLYLRIFSKHFPLSNITLCPIIDFANHSTSSALPQVRPEKVTTDMWAYQNDSVVNPYDLVFISPDCPVEPQEELFLKYGSHSSRTLFTEYGFVDEAADAREGEVEVSDCIDVILSGKSGQSRLRSLLYEEGYIGNWHLYSSPLPAHPSWRFLVALRLINLDLSEEATSEEIDSKLRMWRAVATGESEMISDENELAVRRDLTALCKQLSTRAEIGLRNLASQRCGDLPECGLGWCSWARGNIRRLWEEERRVAQEVLESLDKRVDF